MHGNLISDAKVHAAADQAFTARREARAGNNARARAAAIEAKRQWTVILVHAAVSPRAADQAHEPAARRALRDMQRLIHAA